MTRVMATEDVFNRSCEVLLAASRDRGELASSTLSDPVSRVLAIYKSLGHERSSWQASRCAAAGTPSKVKNRQRGATGEQLLREAAETDFASD